MDREPPQLTLTSLERECKVYFEPWGTEHVLREGDVYHVATWGLAEGRVEVSYVADGIMIGFTSDHEVNVTDSAGRDVPL
jgi:hypothetical protein